MDDFADVARARASYKIFRDAMNAGREIMMRAGVPDPPPVPEFDAIWRRMKPELRGELFAALREQEPATPGETVRFWQPLLRRAFGAQQ